MTSGKYDVGYRKPPVASQFTKGKSGNRKGRPKGVRNIVADLKEELNETLTVNEGGKPRRVKKQRLILKATVTKAIKGHTPSAVFIANQMQRDEENRNANRAETALSAEDDAILERYLAALQSQAEQLSSRKKNVRSRRAKQ